MKNRKDYIENTIEAELMRKIATDFDKYKREITDKESKIKLLSTLEPNEDTPEGMLMRNIQMIIQQMLNQK